MYSHGRNWIFLIFKQLSQLVYDCWCWKIKPKIPFSPNFSLPYLLLFAHMTSAKSPNCRSASFMQALIQSISLIFTIPCLILFKKQISYTKIKTLHISKFLEYNNGNWLTLYKCQWLCYLMNVIFARMIIYHVKCLFSDPNSLDLSTTGSGTIETAQRISKYWYHFQVIEL